ncbi:PTS system mannose/fructose/N-acetylgalactosamine-transporter subunit IIB [Brassicibacter mesophilus]|jgi:mannose/fructose/N-acetylgalactosamine-specific phosphotransferase system component IIB|uniref:PTS system mannose/fructose/N-acetylgalactosamine-transporter subunit IIB n=1 Tax=Brassicibacter mesophilus TaxID=745119 RepID=UPI003D1CD265
MIVHMRIDNRLIHGQVTVSWVSSVGADHLLVVNDEVAEDPIQKQMLPMAARGVKTSVLSIDDAVDYVNNAQGKEKIMLIAKFPSDALVLLEKGLKPEEINVGNQAPLPGTNYKMVTKSIAVTKEDAVIYRKINEIHHLTSQMMPTNSKKDFIALIEEKGF